MASATSSLIENSDDSDYGATQQDTPRSVSPKSTPLPKLQLLIIICIQFAEPITSTVIFPFVNQLVRETGIVGDDERKTGYFAGAIESLFFAAEAITVVQWGRASDKYGRKPILLVGLLGLALAITSFGLSENYWMLLLSRGAQGAFNGNIGVTKSVMSEITDPSNVAQAFSFIPTMWSTGLTIGPIIGGVLARPADEYPDTFGKIALFRKYPYLLACAAAGLIPLLSFLVASTSLKETLPSAIARRKKRNRKRSSSKCSKDTAAPYLEHYTDEPNVIENDDVAQEDDNHESAVPPFRALLIRRVLLPIYNYIFLAFMDQCVQVLLPLVYSTSIQYGGLGFDSFTIGVIMGSWGVVNGIFQIYAFPILLRRFGIRAVYRAAFGSYLINLAAFPIMSTFAKSAGRVDGLVWTVVVLHLLVHMLPFMCYGCIFVYISDGSPGKNTLGTTNALAQLAASTIRTVAPLTASSLYSFSLESGIAGGMLVYWILMAATAVGLVVSSTLPKRLLSEGGED